MWACTDDGDEGEHEPAPKWACVESKDGNNGDNTAIGQGVSERDGGEHEPATKQAHVESEDGHDNGDNMAFGQGVVDND